LLDRFHNLLPHLFILKFYSFIFLILLFLSSEFSIWFFNLFWHILIKCNIILYRHWNNHFTKIITFVGYSHPSNPIRKNISARLMNLNKVLLNMCWRNSKNWKRLWEILLHMGIELLGNIESCSNFRRLGLNNMNPHIWLLRYLRPDFLWSRKKI